MNDLSIIIPTFNSDPSVFTNTLSHLAAQTVQTDQFCVFIVDNGSTESAYLDCCRHFQRLNISTLKEPRPGSTNARICGIRATDSPLLLLLDDDNFLPADYLERSLQLAERHPQIGCFGPARIVPEFEREPSPDLTGYLSHLATRSEDIDWWSNKPDDGLLPYGAGLLIRREVGERHIERIEENPIFQQLGKRGKGDLEEDFGAEDVDFSWAACELGMGRGIFRDLSLTHYIPKRRVEEDYLLKLVRNHAFSYALLERIHDKPVYHESSLDQFRFWFRYFRAGRIRRKFLLAERKGYRNGLSWLIENSPDVPTSG